MFGLSNQHSVITLKHNPMQKKINHMFPVA